MNAMMLHLENVGDFTLDTINKSLEMPYTGVHARLKCEMHFYAKMKDGKQNKTKRSNATQSKAKKNRTISTKISFCVASPAIAAVAFVVIVVVVDVVRISELCGHT